MANGENQKLKREIKLTQRAEAAPQCTLNLETCDDVSLTQWLVAQRPPGAEWLLAHTVGGVIWGRFADGELLLAGADASFADYVPPLKPITVQQVRIFGKSGELFAWRAGAQLCARIWTDQAANGADSNMAYFDEAQMLWGTQVARISGESVEPRAGFTLVSDGVEGLHHAFPMVLTDKDFDKYEDPQKQRPLRLIIRHYVSSNPDDGMNYISGSRLVSVTHARTKRKNETQKEESVQ